MQQISLDSLKSIALFSGLKEYQLELVSHLLVPLMAGAGSYIIRENTKGDEIYILIDGKVKVTKKLVKGVDDQEAGEKAIATITSDVCPTFGENGILGNRERSANVIAVTPCQLLTLSQSDFDDFAENHPAIAYQIMRNVAAVLSDRLVNTDESVVKLATALFISVSR